MGAAVRESKKSRLAVLPGRHVLLGWFESQKKFVVLLHGDGCRVER